MATAFPPSHGALPTNTRPAVTFCASGRPTPTVPYAPLNVGTIRGGSAVNVVPDCCVLEVGLRLLPGMLKDGVVALLYEKVAAAAGADPFEVETQAESPPMLLDASARVYRELLALTGQKEGGSVCYGWRIWELPAVFVEGEFHAVWRSPQEDLFDVTPLPPSMQIDRILFVPDPARVYEGRQVNNVRRALTDNAAIHEFFRACDEGYELMNRGARAEQHGKIVLEGAEGEESLPRRQEAAEAGVLGDDRLPGGQVADAPVAEPAAARADVDVLRHGELTA